MSCDSHRDDRDPARAVIAAIRRAGGRRVRVMP